MRTPLVGVEQAARVASTLLVSRFFSSQSDELEMEARVVATGEGFLPAIWSNFSRHVAYGGPQTFGGHLA